MSTGAHDRAAGAAEIRDAGPGDAAVLAELLDAFNSEFGTPSAPVSELAARLAALLAGDRVAAVVAGDPVLALGVLTFRPALWTGGQVALLEELYVRPHRRGQGLGSAVLDRCLELARERECSEFQINVDEVDVDTRRFYERHGFSNREPGDSGVMFFYYRDL